MQFYFDPRILEYIHVYMIFFFIQSLFVCMTYINQRGYSKPRRFLCVLLSVLLSVICKLRQRHLIVTLIEPYIKHFGSIDNVNELFSERKKKHFKIKSSSIDLFP